MSASEKLKALEASLTPADTSLISFKLTDADRMFPLTMRRALPLIVQVVEAAEERMQIELPIGDMSRLDAALSALEEGLK